MTRLARLLLSVTVLLAASCGFNDAQKIAFVRMLTEAILNATAASSTVVASAPAPLTAHDSSRSSKPADSRNVLCAKLTAPSECTKKLRSPNHATVTAPLFQPRYVPIEFQQAAVRAAMHRPTFARVRCEVAAAREDLRRSSGASGFVFRTLSFTPDAAIPPEPVVIFGGADLVNGTGFVFETVGS